MMVREPWRSCSAGREMSPELLPTAGGPDVLPNPIPEPDPEPPQDDPTPEPSPVPPVPEPAPAFSATLFPRGVSLFKKQLMNFQAAFSGFLNRKLIDGSRTLQGIQTSSAWNSRRAALE